MKYTQLSIPDIVLLQPQVFGDQRGFFMETFFGKWTGAILSAENKKMLWVPPGFAHGFYVLSKEAEFTYKCADYYAPEHERSILWNDPSIAIGWPIVPNTDPILSQKDKDGKELENAEVFT